MNDGISVLYSIFVHIRYCDIRNIIIIMKSLYDYQVQSRRRTISYSYSIFILIIYIYIYIFDSNYSPFTFSPTPSGHVGHRRWCKVAFRRRRCSPLLRRPQSMSLQQWHWARSSSTGTLRPTAPPSLVSVVPTTGAAAGSSSLRVAQRAFYPAAWPILM